MKRILFAIIMSLSALYAMADPDVKLRVGLQVGYNLTKWNGIFNDSLGTKFKNGANAGVMFEIMLNDKWSIQPGLMICMEGTKLDSLPVVGGETLKDEKATFLGVKLPVDIMYSIHNVGPGRLVPSLGLYVNGAIGGKTGGVETFGQESIFQKNWEADIDKPKDLIPDNFDYGLSFKMMYEVLKAPVSGLYAQAGFAYGFTNCHNMNISATIGYRFQYVKALRSAYNTGIFEYNP